MVFKRIEIVLLHDDLDATSVTEHFKFPPVSPQTAVVVYDKKQKQALFLGVNKSNEKATCAAEFQGKQVQRLENGLSLSDIKCFLRAVQGVQDGRLITADFHRGISVLGLVVVALGDNRTCLERFLANCLLSEEPSPKDVETSKAAVRKLQSTWKVLERVVNKRTLEAMVPCQLSRIVLINAVRCIFALSA